MTQLELPAYVDDPPHFLLWRADELVPVLLLLIFGMMIGSPMIFVTVGLFLSKLYGRYSDGTPDGYILHVLYWTGILPSKSKRVPNPYAREYYP